MSTSTLEADAWASTTRLLGYATINEGKLVLRDEQISFLTTQGEQLLSTNRKDVKLRFPHWWFGSVLKITSPGSTLYVAFYNPQGGGGIIRAARGQLRARKRAKPWRQLAKDR